MKTTKADFELFKKYGEEWQRTLGLNDWEIYYTHDLLPDCYGRTYYSCNDRVATIVLTKDGWDTMRPKTSDTLKQVSLHEMLHVLFAPLCDAAETRYTSYKHLEEVEHSIVRHLEKIIS